MVLLNALNTKLAQSPYIKIPQQSRRIPRSTPRRHRTISPIVLSIPSFARPCATTAVATHVALLVKTASWFDSVPRTATLGLLKHQAPFHRPRSHPLLLLPTVGLAPRDGNNTNGSSNRHTLRPRSEGNRPLREVMARRAEAWHHGRDRRLAQRSSSSSSSGGGNSSSRKRWLSAGDPVLWACHQDRSFGG